MDIEEGKIVNSFCNVGSVWCCYPFSENLLCSGGLMDAIYFWDIRMARMVQATPLKHRESSFITSLSSNSIVFGDRKQITRCDLRMAIS